MILPFNMEHQVKSNWCWAATSKSVSVFYSFLSPWTQCKIAAAELSLSCCATPFPGACNVPWYLDRALTRTQNYVSLAGPITWDQVLAQLNLGLVVGARIGWNGGGGHFMVIYGATKTGNTNYLYIDDPIYGKSVLTYNQFLNNYQGSGKWTTTYYTKKHFYIVIFKLLQYDLRLLKPVFDLKPHLAAINNFSDKKFTEARATDDFVLPHHAYVMGLDSIRNKQKLPSKPSTLRVMELVQEAPEALYEVTLDNDKPELVQMNMSKTYFAQMEKSINLLRDQGEKNSKPGELRLLKLPSLNIEAYWLHYDEGGADLFTPVKKFDNDDRFDWNTAYKESDFMSIVQAQAANLNIADDLLGA